MARCHQETQPGKILKSCYGDHYFSHFLDYYCQINHIQPTQIKLSQNQVLMNFCHILTLENYADCAVEVKDWQLVLALWLALFVMSKNGGHLSSMSLYLYLVKIHPSFSICLSNLRNCNFVHHYQLSFPYAINERFFIIFFMAITREQSYQILHLHQKVNVFSQTAPLTYS